jgi:hypothetical protein
MGTSLTPMQTAERDIEELRQSIRRMFSDLLSLSLETHDRTAISKGIQSLQDDLKWEQKKFERGN